MMHIIYPGVQIGENAQIEEYVILGHPPRGREAGDLETRIGDHAVIRSHTVIYAGSVIGDNFATGHGVIIREHSQIGDDVSIGTHSVIEGYVRIASGVRIHSQAFIPERSVLEEGSWVGPNVAFTNALHPTCPRAKECLRGPTLKRGAKIGANSTLLPDITIGEETLVGAGSVVVEDVPAGKVVVGNPAQVIKDISELGCPYGLMERPYGGRER